MFRARRVLMILVSVWLVVGLMPLTSSAQSETCELERTGLRHDAPALGRHGRFWTGTREFRLEAPPDDLRTEERIGIMVTAWYPAQNPDCVEERIDYPCDPLYCIEAYGLTHMNQGRAIKDASPDMTEGPYPLVILSHGLWGHRVWYQRMGEHLASHGFVVLAANHEDTQLNFALWAPAMISRPADVTRLIDLAEALTAPGGDMAGLVDTTKVAVGGESFGGYTALVSAGARLDYRAIEASHQTTPDELSNHLVQSEERLAELAGLDEPPDGPFPSMADSRVDAIFPMSSPTTDWLDIDSASLVTVPTLMLYGSSDADYTMGRPFYAALGSTEKALVVFENAGHAFYGYTCWESPETRFRCMTDDVWDVERLQDLTNHYVTAFLLTELKNSRPASGYLQPEDAEAFRGVEVDSTIQPRQGQ